MKQRIFALLLTVAMAASCFVGCGTNTETSKDPVSTEKVNESTVVQESETESAVVQETDPDNGEPYNVHIIYRIAPQNEADMQAVADYINTEILPDLLPNTTVSFEFIPASEYVEKIKLKAASGEKMDLVLSMISQKFEDLVSMGAFVPWDEYLEYMPNTMELIPESWWDGVTLDGEIYGIPNYQITARSFAICIDEQMAKKYNINIDDINNLDDFEEKYLKVLKANGEYAKGTITQAVKMWTNKAAEFFDLCDTEQISGLLVVDKNDPTKVLNMFEAEGVVESLKRDRKWVEEGWVNPDALVGLDEKSVMEMNLLGSRLESWQPNWDAHLKNQFNRDFLVKRVGTPLVTTSSVRSTMTSIGYTSENPYRAAKLFDLINSNEELFNAICYGIEGKHYEWNDDGTVKILQDSGYNISTWAYQYGNTMQAYRLEGKAADYNKQVDELNRSAAVGTIFGFSYSNAAVTTEWASVNAIISNYKDGFNGARYEDVQAELDKMNAELYAAGLQKIIDDCQAQLDAWMAAK